MPIKIRRGEFSLQILQGKMRSTANACNLTPRISIRGEISTHERLRSRFTVQIMDARTKIQKTMSNLYYLAFQSLTSILCQTKFSIKFFHSVTLFLILKQNENFQHCNSQETVPTPKTPLRDLNRLVPIKRSHMLAVQAVKRLDGFYTKNQNVHNFKSDNVQT